MTVAAGVGVVETGSGHRLFGKYRGIVVDVEDPKDRGRIRARVPEVLGHVESGWANPAAPYAGPGVGVWTIPPVGAGVWIEFEAGDVSRPIWTGCWWAEDDRPSNHERTKAVPPLKIIRSEQGLMVSMDDRGEVISLSDEQGSNIVTIEVRRGQVTVKGAAKVVVEAPQIELVENAAHPVVFGDELLQYLNQIVQLYQTHVHPGELALGVLPVTPAPPAPPFPPPMPTMLSNRVKAG
jgi:uncharacterized protein involved in type VI secretion and phage assembly